MEIEIDFLILSLAVCDVHCAASSYLSHSGGDDDHLTVSIGWI